MSDKQRSGKAVSRSFSSFSRSTLDSPRPRSCLSLLSYMQTSTGFLYFHPRSGRPRPLHFSLSRDLTALTMLRDGALPKSFHLLELRLLQDLSMDMTRLLRQCGFDRRVYGFRLATRKKTYELAAEDAETRDGWTNMLKTAISAYTDFHQRDALLRYVNTLCKLKDTELRNYVNRVKAKSYSVVKVNLEGKLAQASREIAALVVEQIIVKLELEEERTKVATLTVKIDDLEAKERQKVCGKGLQRLLQAESWKLVLQSLPIAALLTLSQVSKQLRRLCGNRLSSQFCWSQVSFQGLEPRSQTWPLYFRRFRPSPPSIPASPASSDMLGDIQRDLSRSQSSHRAEVERILVGLCERYAEVGYCQGMHFTTEFLYSVLKSEQRTSDLLLRLMAPPYSLAEVWKPGLPRAKLVAFQLDQLVQLRLPRLAVHCQALELPLEVMVAPWVLTLFTQLTNLPPPTLALIWDLFLTRGWAAVLAVSLVLLYLSEEEVLGRSLEHTMAVFDKDLALDFSLIRQLYCRFEPDAELMMDLERSFRHQHPPRPTNVSQ